MISKVGKITNRYTNSKQAITCMHLAKNKCIVYYKQNFKKNNYYGDQITTHF